MSEIVLTGLDGANPMGFMAALGVLNALSDSAQSDSAPPRLSWRNEGYWRPVIHANGHELSKSALIDLLMADLASMKNDPALALSYGDGTSPVRDLKPPPDVFRSYLADLAETATPDNRRSVDMAAAFATDVAVDNNGNTKPTALHFTAGQQKFLEMVHGLIGELRPEDFAEALWGPWRYERLLPVLQWDSTVFRDYALRAGDPSKEKKAGVPGADWLAVRGLAYFRVAAVGKRIRTTCCGGEWKPGRFRWPVWEAALTRDAVQTVMQSKALAEMPAPVRLARGVAAVFEAAIRRSDQGGYGSFSPAAVI